MPRYQYECDSCGRSEEHVYTMSERPSALDCPCGGNATQIINWQGQCFVKGGELPFDRRHMTRPVGWHKKDVKDGEAFCREHERRYRKQWEQDRREALEAARDGGRKGTIRHIGSIPAELHAMRRSQYGPEYWTENPREALARDNLLFTKKK